MDLTAHLLSPRLLPKKALHGLLAAACLLLMLLPVRLSAADNLTISGTVFGSDGTTALGANKTVAVSLDGAAPISTTETNASGEYSITGLTMTEDTIITLYIDGESEDGVTVSRGSDANMSDMHIFQNHLIIRSGIGSGAPALTNATLNVADNSADGDITALYTMSSDVLTVASGKKLRIWTDSTYAPGDAISVDDIDIRGTFAMGTSSVTVRGSWDATGGTVTSDNTVLFQASSSETITNAGNAFTDVIFTPVVSSAAWTVVDDFLVTGTQTIQNPDGSTDTAGPVISDVTESLVTRTSAVIEWITDESATSLVLYGTAANQLTSTKVGSTQYNIDHGILLTDLEEDTTYYYRVVSTDLAGNTSSGSTTSFTTEKTPQLPGTVETTAQAGGAAGGGTGGRDTCVLRRQYSALRLQNLFLREENGSLTATWTTTEPALAIMRYGLTSVNDHAIVNFVDLTKEHTARLETLLAGASYRIQAVGIDECGIVVQSPILIHKAQGGSGNQTSQTNTISIKAALTKAFEQTLRTLANLPDGITLADIERLLELEASSLNLVVKSIPGPQIGTPGIMPSPTGAVINWQTSEPANATVSFASVEELEDGKNPNVLGIYERYDMEHSISLTGLKPDTLYRFRVESTTPYGTKTTSEEFTFRTTRQTVAIVDHSVEIVSSVSAVFQWQTNVETNSTLRIIPYRNGLPDARSAEVLQSTTLTTTHALSYDRFEAGSYYDIELEGRDSAGVIAQRTIRQFSTNQTNIAPQIDGVQTDTAVISGAANKVQTIISWTTNERTAGRVYYQQGVRSDPTKPFASATPENNNYTRQHKVLLPALAAGQVYSFQIEITDATGEVVRSNTYTLLTPKQQQGIIRLILYQIDQIFGWLFKIR